MFSKLFDLWSTFRMKRDPEYWHVFVVTGKRANLNNVIESLEHMIRSVELDKERRAKKHGH